MVDPMMLEPMMLEPNFVQMVPKFVQMENMMIGMVTNEGLMMSGAGHAMGQGPVIKSETGMFSPSLSGPLDVEMFQIGALDPATEGAAMLSTQDMKAAFAIVALGVSTLAVMYRRGGRAAMRVVVVSRRRLARSGTSCGSRASARSTERG
jgi:hypothetical protein